MKEFYDAGAFPDHSLEWLYDFIRKAPQVLFKYPTVWGDLTRLVNDPDRLEEYRIGAQRWCALLISQEYEGRGPLPQEALMDMCKVSLVLGNLFPMMHMTFSDYFTRPKGILATHGHYLTTL